MPHILLAGCGHLGQALLRRWLGADEKFKFTVIKPTSLPEEFSGNSRVVQHTRLPPELPPPGAIIYAVRPQQLPAVLPDYAALAAGCVNISVAAGWTIAKLARYLGAVAIIRTMPNVPAQIGQGITPMMANAACDGRARGLAEALFGAAGETLWLDDEAMLDPATALSGSGPAYVYLLTAAMEESGVKLGLTPAAAALLAQATVRGAANYMAQSGQSAEMLMRAMLLPGGTTEAAMQRLLADDGMKRLLHEAMQRASARAQEIGARGD